MTANHLKQLHQQQRQIFIRFRAQVRAGNFVCSVHNPQIRLQAKLHFLRQLKIRLKKAFAFNDFQAEFVKNEAMSKVLHPRHTPEKLLVAANAKEAEKLVHTSYVLGHHYFRFIMTML